VKSTYKEHSILIIRKGPTDLLALGPRPIGPFGAGRIQKLSVADDWVRGEAATGSRSRRGSGIGATTVGTGGDWSPTLR